MQRRRPAEKAGRRLLSSEPGYWIEIRLLGCRRLKLGRPRRVLMGARDHIGSDGLDIGRRQRSLEAGHADAGPLAIHHDRFPACLGRARRRPAQVWRDAARLRAIAMTDHAVVEVDGLAALDQGLSRAAILFTDLKALTDRVQALEDAPAAAAPAKSTSKKS